MKIKHTITQPAKGRAGILYNAPQKIEKTEKIRRMVKKEPIPTIFK